MPVSRRTFLLGSVAPVATPLVAVSPSPLSRALRKPRTLKEKVGQLFVVSFRGTSPDSAFLTLLQRAHLGGVILYQRNYASPGQLKTLLGRLQQAASYPLLVGTDQEGGAVVRLHRGIPTFPAEAE